MSNRLKPNKLNGTIYHLRELMKVGHVLTNDDCRYLASLITQMKRVSIIIAADEAEGGNIINNLASEINQLNLKASMLRDLESRAYIWKGKLESLSSIVSRIISSAHCNHVGRFEIDQNLFHILCEVFDSLSKHPPKHDSSHKSSLQVHGKDE